MFYKIIQRGTNTSDHTNMRKPVFCLCKNKDADQLCSTAQLISASDFPARIVQFLLYLYPKFQDSNFLLRLYRPVCVRPGRKHQRPVFSRRSSYVKSFLKVMVLAIFERHAPKKPQKICMRFISFILQYEDAHTVFKVSSFFLHIEIF